MQRQENKKEVEYFLYERAILTETDTAVVVSGLTIKELFAYVFILVARITLNNKEVTRFSTASVKATKLTCGKLK